MSITLALICDRCGATVRAPLDSQSRLKGHILRQEAPGWATACRGPAGAERWASGPRDYCGPCLRGECSTCGYSPCMCDQQ